MFVEWEKLSVTVEEPCFGCFSSFLSFLELKILRDPRCEVGGG